MKKSKKGFTIVELVIVIAVIGILSAILIPTFANLVNSAKEAKVQAEVSNAYISYAAENAGNEANLLAQDEVFICKEAIAATGVDVYHYVENANGAEWAKLAEVVVANYDLVGEYNGYHVYKVHVAG